MTTGLTTSSMITTWCTRIKQGSYRRVSCTNKKICWCPSLIKITW